MTPAVQRLLRDVAALMPPRDDTEAERMRFAEQVGALQGRAEVALWMEFGGCLREGCAAIAVVAGRCAEHAAEVSL